jgi:hypothetical protein
MSELKSNPEQRRTTMYQPYDEATASTTDRVAWALCQIIDDDAPLRWTRYRFVAECIAINDKLMTDLNTVSEQRPWVTQKVQR